MHDTLDGVKWYENFENSIVAGVGSWIAGVPHIPGEEPLASDVAKFLVRYVSNQGGINTYSAENILSNFVALENDNCISSVRKKAK